MKHPTTSPPERRQHERVPVRADVMLSQNGHTERMSVHDVSMSGAFFETTLHDHIGFKIGAHCEVVLFVDEFVPCHEVDDGHTVHAHARIVRRDPGAADRPAGLGVVFERLDLESLEKLRALVNRAG